MNVSNNDRLNLSAGLSSLTYRSRVVTPMSAQALRELESAAQLRNRSEGLTSLMVYEDGQIFQWLEGPMESLDRVWSSVRNDTRHTDIADVTVGTTPARMFEGCAMRVAIRGEQPIVGAAAAAATKAPVIPYVPVLVEALVVPQMFSKHGTLRRFLPPVSPLATRLSRLLLSDDEAGAATILGRLHADAGSLAPLCATVIEPAARTIGDTWLSDDCSQVSMTLALCRLGVIVRDLNAAASQVTVGLPVVLVAPQPGEAHLLGASLDGELLWQAGWDTHREFPATDRALQALVSETWFDVLDLSLSPALARSESLAEMTQSIFGARAASLNPALTVVVGGRAFFEQCEGSASVGADASSTSALQVVLTATAAHQTTLRKLSETTAREKSR